MTTRTKKILAVCLSLSAITLAALLYYQRGPEIVAPEALERELAKFSAAGKEHADPANCMECHAEAMAGWKDSHHALANAPLSETDLHRLLNSHGSLLETREMKWHSGKTVPVLTEGDLPPYPVVGTIGLAPLIQYLLLAPDGRLQTHDISWDVENEEWFSTFEREDTEPRLPGEWGHWTGQGMNWDANCAYCHMTEYQKNYDPATDRYNTQWSHMAITCAQCHPGMERHLSQIRNGNEQFEESLSPTQVMDYCASCHSRRTELTPHDFVAGNKYEDHFQITLADVPGIYHPDGQVIGENYVYGSLMMSKMGHAGITCMDCHDPHSTGHILPFENNALCMRCHAGGLQEATIIDPVAHSHHPSTSTGNLCVECHMPVSFFMGRDGRRDHSFSHPDPQLTLEMGIPNACNECHKEESIKWTLEYMSKWYGDEINTDRRTKARLISDLFAGTAGISERLRAATQGEPNRFWKATLISLFRYLPPESESLQLLTSYLDDEDSMVRAAAVKVIGLEALGQEQQEKLLLDPVREVRLSAMTSTQQMPTANPAGEAELKDYLAHTADSPVGALRYAGYWQSRGDKAQAVASIANAVKLEPINSEVWRFASIQLHSLGESELADTYLQKALKLNPRDAQIQYNLGLLSYETGDTEAALIYLNRAVELDPQLESAWYNLIVLYWSMEQFPSARKYLQEALQALPDSQRLRQLSVSLQSRE